MKDKLTKHNRKPSYFMYRRLFIILIISLVVLTAFALPITISLVKGFWA
jgi:hypothetical protein